MKFHTVFQYHYFLTFIFLKLNTYSFVLSFVQTYDFCMYMHIFCFCVYIQRCVRDTSLWQLKLLTLFSQCHKVSPIHFIVLRIGYIKKPFQLDDYSIDMGGMNLDIFPKKKKAVLTQLYISEAEASSEHFHKHGPFHTDNERNSTTSTRTT